MKNLEDFVQQVRPGTRKSQLHEFWPAINSLRGRGYTLRQIQLYLAENGVVVSIAWLSAFIHRHDSRMGNHTKPVSTAAVPIAKSNPLHALSGKPREGEFSPIPPAKIEIDNS